MILLSSTTLLWAFFSISSSFRCFSYPISKQFNIPQTMLSDKILDYDKSRSRAEKLSLITFHELKIIKSRFTNGIECICQRMNNKTNEIKKSIAENPWTYLSIPISAAFVGYITNWVGVKMLFYPANWIGIPFKKWPEQPLGLIGWQGVVPAKRVPMSNRMVDVTISRLLQVSEVFKSMEPKQMALLLTPTITKLIFNGIVPKSILESFMTLISKDVVLNIEKLFNIKSLVVSGLTVDTKILGNFFQQVAKKELNFLVNSGIGFGFLLGILQMGQWMVYPKNWTLPVGGALVGFITNWIALKWIFEPLEPTKVGPFLLQGMFLKRQKEVSADFSSYISTTILTSEKVWQSILDNINSQNIIKDIIRKHAPFLSSKTVTDIISELQVSVGKNPLHPIHKYTNKQLNLKSTLIKAMNKLSPQEFEKVLHPVFQEDEIILIVAGGVLGAFSGLLQVWMNEYLERRDQRQKQMKLLSETNVNVNIVVDDGLRDESGRKGGEIDMQVEIDTYDDNTTSNK